MLDHSLTRQERKLAIVLRWWAVLFTIAGLGFIILPDWILKGLNTIGHVIFRWKGPPIEPSAERFWLVITISLMVVLIISAIKAQLDIIKNINYVKIIIVSKLVSTLGFLIVLIFFQHSFAYLAGAVVDGLILAITWLAYRRAAVSRYGK